MKTSDRNDIELNIGDSVKHFSRKTYDCQDRPEYIGKVVSLDPERLPLIGIDCGCEFTRWIPYFDIVHYNQYVKH
jgi:hypothetical protein